MKKIVTKIKQSFLWLLIPIQKLLQRTGRQESPMTPEIVKHILEIIEPGDVLVSHEQGRPTSKLIPGDYDHAVMYVGEGKIVEAVGDRFVDKVNIGGVREVDLVKWLYQVKFVAIARPNLPKYIRQAAAKNAPLYIGTGYDYIFGYGNEKIYCSELPYLCYRTEDRNFMSDIGPDEEILPQMYRDRCDKDFILIFEFKG